MSTKNQHGFSVVEVVIAVFVVAALVVTGYLAYTRMNEASKTPSATEQADQGTAPSAPTISDSSDLDTASKTLDDTNLDASLSDSSDLDAELNSF